MSMSMPPILIGAPVPFLPFRGPGPPFGAVGVPTPPLAVESAAPAGRLAGAPPAAVSRNAAMSLRTVIRSVLSAVVSLRMALPSPPRPRAAAGTPRPASAGGRPARASRRELPGRGDDDVEEQRLGALRERGRHLGPDLLQLLPT